MSRIPLISCSRGYFLGSIVSGRMGPRFVRMPRASQVKASWVWPDRDSASAKCAYSLGQEGPRQYPPHLGVSNARVGKSAPLNLVGSFNRFIIAAIRAGADS